MKLKYVALIGFALSVSAFDASAINHAYRAKLEKSGCTEMNAGQGCNINKSADWNNKHFYQKEKVTHNTGLLGHLSGDTETILGTDIGEAADYLLSQGWKPYNGVWKKAGYIMKVVVEDGVVRNAQLTK